MGLIIDIVPNHMGVGSDNPWWKDMLEWGEQSPFAGFFDIDWEPRGPTLSGKLLLPILVDHFGKVLETGQISLAFDDRRGTFSAVYGEHRLPISPRQYGFILAPALDALEGPSRELLAAVLSDFTGLFVFALDAGNNAQRERALQLKNNLARLVRADGAVGTAIARGIARFQGVKGDLASWRALGRLLDSQVYRLAWWRTASDDINYRRFFDINELVGLRQDAPEESVARQCQGVGVSSLDLRRENPFAGRRAARLVAGGGDDRL
jgi:(1->4)-alpha-D-glucan 1-alpha-D-glucosylmutase